MLAAIQARPRRQADPISASVRRTNRIMIDETLLAALGSTDSEAEAMLTQAFGKRVESDDQSQYMDSFLGDQIKDLSAGKLIKGKVVGFAGEDVVIEVGLKSEGLVPKEEFEGIQVK